MLKVIVKGAGNGMGYNSYPASIEFFVSESADEYEIKAKAIRRLRDATACDSVTIHTIEVGSMVYTYPLN